MPKRPCTHRAKWRLTRGKPAQPLPAHYRLDCDYGTALVAVFNEGEGDNPLYLCEQHVAAMEMANGHSVRPVHSDIRLVDGESVNGVVAAKDDVRGLDGRSQDAGRRGEPSLEPRTEGAEIAAAEPSAPAPSPSPAIENTTTPAPELASAKPAKIDPAPGPAPFNSAAPPANAAPAKAPSLAAKSPLAKVAAAKNAPAKTATPKVATAKPGAPKPAPAKATAAKSNASSKGPARDLAYGNPAKALVDETIWNLAPGDYDAYKTAVREGKSPLEAAQAAGGQLAVVHRKIQEYAAKLETLLSASQAAIRVDESIRSVLDREISKIIGSDSMADVGKDAAVAHLGEFQEWVNGELRRQATPLEAYRVALAVAERAHWGAASCRISSELRPVYREVYRTLREAVRAAVPDAREIEERLANLYAAKSDLDAPPDKPISAPADLGLAASATGSAPEQNFAEL